MIRIFTITLFSIFLLINCSSTPTDPQLGYLGPRDVDPISGDTTYHEVFDFALKNQDGKKVGLENYKGKIIVGCFFFTNCPSICPMMTSQFKRLQHNLGNDKNVQLLSITVDPERDSIGQLKSYANQYELNTNNWDFLTGNKAMIYELAVYGFSLAAQEDALAPGGFLHSQYAMLIDTNRNIRGKYDATNSDEIDQLLKDIQTLK